MGISGIEIHAVGCRAAPENQAPERFQQEQRRTNIKAVVTQFNVQRRGGTAAGRVERAEVHDRIPRPGTETTRQVYVPVPYGRRKGRDTGSATAGRTNRDGRSVRSTAELEFDSRHR